VVQHFGRHPTQDGQDQEAGPLEQNARQQASRQAFLQHADGKAHLGGGWTCIEAQVQVMTTSTPSKVTRRSQEGQGGVLDSRVTPGKYGGMPMPELKAALTWHALPQHEQLGEHHIGAPVQPLHKQLLEHGDVGRGAAAAQGGGEDLHQQEELQHAPVPRAAGQC
jgi:hypothetical protein